MANRKVSVLLRTAAFTMALAFAAQGAAASARSLAPGEFADYVEDGRTRLHHAAEALPRFDALLAAVRTGEGGLAGLPLEALRKLAGDAHVANFYYAGARADAHREIIEELLRRSEASDQELADFHATLVADRRWDEARAFAARFPEITLEKIPDVIDQTTGLGAPAYLRHDPATGHLVRESFDAGSGPLLLVVSHPGCAFSRRAMAAIAANPELDQALPARRLFLAPTFGGLKLDWISRWNADQPGFPHVLVDQPARWPQVRSWATPQFLFLVDGDVVASVEGWPGDEQAEALMAAARLGADAAD